LQGLGANAQWLYRVKLPNLQFVTRVLG
jgi:hypothetical protein